MNNINRAIININHDLCTGCGECLFPGAQGAIEIINDKACLRSKFCVSVCPTGALTIEASSIVAVAEQAASAHKQTILEQPQFNQVMKCSLCDITENDRPLLPLKSKGESNWVCVRCIPTLIRA
jgi:Fe-S-cluster-containing hydrogenase component 2